MNENKTRGDMPLTPAEELAAGVLKPGGRDGVEIVIDHTFVSIPLSRYNELIRDEATMDTLVSFYLTKGTGYEMNNLMEALFGPREEGDDA